MTPERARELEERRCAAMLAADVPALDGLLAVDLAWVHSSGRRDDKAAILRTIASGETRYVRIDRSDEQIRIVGSVAVVSGIAEMDVSVRGTARTVRNRYLNVWALQEGEAVLLAWQSTALSA